MVDVTQFVGIFATHTLKYGSKSRVHTTPCLDVTRRENTQNVSVNKGVGVQFLAPDSDPR